MSTIDDDCFEGLIEFRVFFDDEQLFCKFLHHCIQFSMDNDVDHVFVNEDGRFVAIEYSKNCPIYIDDFDSNNEATN